MEILQMRNRILTVLGIALCAAMSSTYAESDLQGVVANGSSIQGVTTNGSSVQGVSWNGSNLQGVSWNGSNVQGVDPNGTKPQDADRKGTEASQAATPSTGLKLRGVHVVGGRLLPGDAPSRTPRKE
jgi:uncharacterized protein YjbI with pentapeptide repeats